MCTGWTWDYVGWNIDLPRLQKLSKYWDEFPPTHILLRLIAKYKPAPKQVTTAGPAAQNPEVGDIEMFMRMAPRTEFQKPRLKDGNER